MTLIHCTCIKKIKCFVDVCFGGSVVCLAAAMFHLPMTFGSTLEVEGDFWNKQQLENASSPPTSVLTFLNRPVLSLFLGSWGDYALHTTTALWAGHTCNHMRKHKHMHPHREAHCISMSTHMHTHTHTHIHTHSHTCMHAQKHTQKSKVTQREKLTSNFHRISQAENNIALYLVPGSVHSPRDVETNLKDLQLHYEICLHTHTKNRAYCFYSQTSNS